MIDEEDFIHNVDCTCPEGIKGEYCAGCEDFGCPTDYEIYNGNYPLTTGK